MRIFARYTKLCLFLSALFCFFFNPPTIMAQQQAGDILFYHNGGFESYDDCAFPAHIQKGDTVTQRDSLVTVFIRKGNAPEGAQYLELRSNGVGRFEWSKHYRYLWHLENRQYYVEFWAKASMPGKIIAQFEEETTYNTLFNTIEIPVSTEWRKIPLLIWPKKACYAEFTLSFGDMPRAQSLFLDGFTSKTMTTSVDEQNGNTGPGTFQLLQSYPNPANPTATIEFDLAKAQNVTLRIYNALGQKVRTLLQNTAASIGRTQVVWDGKNQSGNSVPSGIYYYRIDAEGINATRKMLMLK